MAKWANVLGAQSGVPLFIGELIDYDPLNIFIAGAFIPCPEDCVPGWIYLKDVGFFNPPHNFMDNEKYFTVDEHGNITPDESKKPDLILQLELKINNETDSSIMNSFVYSEKEFYLSLENQFNYKAVYDFRESLSYPYAIKGKTEYLVLATSDEVALFYMSQMLFIQLCIHNGWQEKDALKTKTMQELIELS